MNSRAQHITWRNIKDADLLHESFVKELKEDNFRKNRVHTIQQYHPFNDGLSSRRMIAAVEGFIRRFGVPKKRALNIYRRYQMNKLFGPKPSV